MTIKYRLRFSKLGYLRFIGHLDLMKLFQRCIKRAKLPIAYSVGFNPHPLLSFALPLSLGMGSLGEYAELVLQTEMPVEVIMEQINAALPEGLKITNGRLLLQGEKTAASLVAGGLYELHLPGAHGLAAAVEDLLSSESIVVTDPKKNREVNIRPNVFSLEAIGEDRVSGLISTGSGNHLKPEFLGRALYEKMRITPGPFDMAIERKELYKRQGEAWISLD